MEMILRDSVIFGRSIDNGLSQGINAAFVRFGADTIATPQIYGPIVFNQNNTLDFGYVEIKGSETVPVGAKVCKSGIESFWKCGKLTATGATVIIPNGPDGPLMIKDVNVTSACMSGGDRGGPVVSAGGQAQGILLGGNLQQLGEFEFSNCYLSASKRKTYFQPINPILEAFDLKLRVEKN